MFASANLLIYPCVNFVLQNVTFATHRNRTCRCYEILQAAELVLAEGVTPLSHVFKTVFPNVSYNSGIAKRRLLQMPTAVVRIEKKSPSAAELYIMEKFENFDYACLVKFLNTLSSSRLSEPRDQPITSEQVKELLSVTQNERERECVRFAIYKATGVTPTAARRLFGFENMAQREDRIKKCIEEAKEIKEAVESLAASQDKALLDSLGIWDSSTEEDSGSETDCPDREERDSGKEVERNASPIRSNQNSTLVQIMQNSNYNWFEFVDRVQSLSTYEEQFNTEEFFLEVPQLDSFTQELIVQSHRASKDSSYSEERTERIVNGEIVSESEEDNPEDYIGILCDVKSNTELIRKKRMAIKRKANRLRSKLLAEQRFLSRKVSKRTSKILQDHPDIGKTIESFVCE